MKWIDKSNSPTFFEQWKAAFQVTHGRPPQYADLIGEPRQSLKMHLLQEQGYICCYCMAEIYPGGDHLEHFIPRSAAKKNPVPYQGQDIELGYENLFLSCEGEHFAGDHCGRFKDDADAIGLLSPADPITDTVFTYFPDGRIDSQDQKTKNTISAANLNSLALIRHRQSALYAAGFYADDFEEKRESLIQFFKSRDSSGSFQPFCMAVVYIMENL